MMAYAADGVERLYADVDAASESDTGSSSSADDCVNTASSDESDGDAAVDSASSDETSDDGDVDDTGNREREFMRMILEAAAAECPRRAVCNTDVDKEAVVTAAAAPVITTDDEVAVITAAAASGGTADDDAAVTTDADADAAAPGGMVGTADDEVAVIAAAAALDGTVGTADDEVAVITAAAAPDGTVGTVGDVPVWSMDDDSDPAVATAAADESARTTHDDDNNVAATVAACVSLGNKDDDPLFDSTDNDDIEHDPMISAAFADAISDMSDELSKTTADDEDHATAECSTSPGKLSSKTVQKEPQRRQAPRQNTVKVKRPAKRIASVVGTVVALRTPFVKVEDVTSQFRPSFKELPHMPTTEFDLSAAIFDAPKQSTNVRRKKPQQSQQYCECCDCYFYYTAVHLRSRRHQAFASTAANYSGVDALAAQLGGLDDDVAVELGGLASVSNADNADAKTAAAERSLGSPPAAEDTPTEVTVADDADDVSAADDEKTAQRARDCNGNVADCNVCRIVHHQKTEEVTGDALAAELGSLVDDVAVQLGGLATVSKADNAERSVASPPAEEIIPTDVTVADDTGDALAADLGSLVHDVAVELGVLATVNTADNADVDTAAAEQSVGSPPAAEDTPAEVTVADDVSAADDEKTVEVIHQVHFCCEFVTEL